MIILFSLIKNIYHRVLNLTLVYKLKYLNCNICILKGASFFNATFESFISIGENNKLLDTFVGKGSYTGRNVELRGVKLGRFCSLGSFIHNTSGHHPS